MKGRFTAIYFAGMLVEILIRLPRERQRHQTPKTDRRVTRAEQSLLTGLSVGVVVLPAIYSLTSWLDVANYRWSSTTKARMGRIGTILLSAAIWLFWRAHRDLGNNWSPSLEIDAHQTLVTEGVYRAIRHPMYTSQLLWGIGQALLLPNWIAGSGGLLAFLALYQVRVPHEERLMLDHFGNAYREYMQHTGRVLPRLPREDVGAA